MPALGWGAAQRPQNGRRARVKTVSNQQPDPASRPAPVATPLTLEQLPAQPPQVSYLNGQLTIISRNSTLGDILHAVARQTGAVIELPPGAGFERVAGRMGPGAARDVLSELLNGSRYDYVMIASASNPGGLQHVILTPKSAGSEGPSGSPPVATYQPQPQPQADQQVMPDVSEVPPDPSDNDQDMPTAEEPPPEEQPADQPQQQPYPGTYAPGTPGAQQPPGIKTPQQLLQELQRMQQMQQQQQQQQQQNQPQ